MGILYDKVMISQESRRQIFIKELRVLGITEYQNQSIDDLDYYTLRSALSIARIRVESDENRWF
ncbi:hypothetical protein [Cytobacillus praedii]|uniref:hypothetical protein n=1 Tax=Cytobacillus praedii TaxID=1742358 RepID=UPI002E1FE088|nr:hypothetical protein [Cytobacillus praedii]